MLDGKLHGSFIEYNEDNSIKQTGFYENGRKQGRFTSYYENGRICACIEYKDDLLNGIE
jgi:antitoxin component YwqK of YwqJK toxin-antitoxin module